MQVATSQLRAAAEAEPSLVEEYDRRLDRFFVIALTVIAAILRLLYLNRPAMSEGEAQVYARATGSFIEMLDFAAKENRLPLVSELYWALARLAGHVPPIAAMWVMRSMAALAGVFLVPAMYVLAKQIVSRRAAVLAAAFTCCSAYQLLWSRQADAHSLLWLACTLNLASLLWWLRDRRTMPYLCWLASGVTMVALGVAGMIVLAIEPLILLTFRRPRRLVNILVASPNDVAATMVELAPRSRINRAVSVVGKVFAFLIGIVIITSGVTFYRVMTPRAPLTDATTMPATQSLAAASTAPVAALPESTTDRVAQAASVYLSGWEWPTTQQRASIDRRDLQYHTWGLEIVCVIVALALWPWQRTRPKPLRQRRPWEQAVLPEVRFSYESGETEADRHPQSLWRRTLWLASLIVIPTYLLYCVSIDEITMPREWGTAFLDLIKSHRSASITALCAVALYFVYWTRRQHPMSWRKLRRALKPAAQVTAIALFLALICAGIATVCDHFTIRMDWSPQLLGIVWAPLIIALCAMLVRIDIARVRRIAIFLLLALNVAEAVFVVVRNPEPRIDLLAADVLTAQGDRSPIRAFLSTQLSLDATAKAQLAMQSHTAMTPQKMLEPWTGREPWKIRRVANERIIRTELEHARGVEQVVVWDDADHPTPTDRTGKLEEGGWTAIDDRRYPSWDHWTWERRTTLRRRLFVRSKSKVTSPQLEELRKQPPELDEIMKQLQELQRLQRELEHPSNAKPQVQQPKITPTPKRPPTRPAPRGR